jgi:hypothetical protein
LVSHLQKKERKGINNFTGIRQKGRKEGGHGKGFFLFF